MPFAGVLAGTVCLDNEPRLPGTHTSDTSLSYFGIMKCAYDIEGWGDLYKGFLSFFGPDWRLCPMEATLLSGCETETRALLAVSNPCTTALTLAVSILPTLLLVPMQIIINCFLLLGNYGHTVQLQSLTSSLPSKCVAFTFFIQGLVISALVVIHYTTERALPAVAFFGGMLSVILLATSILMPLDIMAACLNLCCPEALTTPAESPTPDVPSMYVEPMMHFQTEEAPYTSSLNCSCRMMAKEGWSALVHT
ncbi:hypothetical protein DFH08DRAFT_808401 [Mycena albidolilacea]|uniref:Uncharacterized protein n=1 Tax=Mycena albidolilacea TaxID=1033008 RepID=A0AAD7ES01_9AGAR|nr:hypothetical protein DFH08DRAFT_808401 [Mycena albidolilacea]